MGFSSAASMESSRRNLKNYSLIYPRNFKKTQELYFSIPNPHLSYIANSYFKLQTENKRSETIQLIDLRVSRPEKPLTFSPLRR